MKHLDKITEGISDVLKKFVFEENNEQNRKAINKMVTEIAEQYKSNMHDYLVICDERVNTEEVINNNEFVCHFYFQENAGDEFILSEQRVVKTKIDDPIDFNSIEDEIHKRN